MMPGVLAALSFVKRVPKPVWAVLFVAGCAIAVALKVRGALNELRAERDAARAEAHAAAIGRDSIEAVLDTTRVLYTKALGDSMAVWERRVVQLDSIARDRLDRERQQSSAARAELRLQIGELQAEVFARDSLANDSVRIATFEHREPPLTLQARVFIPPVPAAPVGMFRVRVDEIPVSVRFACADQGTFKAARVQLAVPYETVKLAASSVVMDSDYCNPAPAQLRGKARPSVWTVAGAAIVGGAIVCVITQCELPEQLRKLKLPL